MGTPAPLSVRRSPASPDPTAPTADRPRAASAPTRKRFALTGRSVALDPRTNAVRRDLADIRLADRVFAPHYAEPLPRLLIRAAALTAGDGAETLADMAAGEAFDVLELSGDQAWGFAPGRGLAGYLPADALGAA